MMTIYDKYLNLLSLLPEDIEELKKKRGFTDKTIEHFKLKTLIPEEQKKIIRSKMKLKDADVIAAGFGFSTNGKIKMANALLKRNIIIPYFDPDGKCIHLRPHKDGLPGQEIRYFPCLHQEQPKRIILTESEFKAMALWQWGFDAVGLQGIATWSGKKFSNLKQYLLSLKGKNKDFEIIILYDTEDKNDPTHPKFEDCKNDPYKKYNTEFYGYLLCNYLFKKNFNCRIARLPEAWIENGKIDLDGALAQGRTKKDIEEVLNIAVTPPEYRKSLQGECREIVERKIKKYFFRMEPLVERNNSYFWQKLDKDGNIESENQISNFTLKLSHAVQLLRRNNEEQVEGEIHRYVQFTDTYGKKTKEYEITSKQMNSNQDFKTFCFNKGDHVWKGNQAQLDKLWEYLFVFSEGIVLVRPDEVGMIEQDEWLFKDCFITQGEVLEYDGSGSVRKGMKGWKKPLQAPELITEKELNVPHFLHLLKQNLGYKAFLGIGWLGATFLSDLLFKKEKSFPILFLFGRRGAGKNIFGEWLMKLAGMETQGMSFQTSTPKGILRELGKNSNLPVWINEYRNSAPDYKKEFLLNVYGREGQLKAQYTNDQQTCIQAIRGTVLLSGQETPSDNGVFSRCLQISFSEYRLSSKTDPLFHVKLIHFRCYFLPTYS